MEHMSLEELHDVLTRMIDNDLVVQLARRPGQKEERYRHRLSEDLEDDPTADVAVAGPAAVVVPPPPRRDDRFERLERELTELRDERVEALGADVLELRRGAARAPRSWERGRTRKWSSTMGVPSMQNCCRSARSRSSKQLAAWLERWDKSAARRRPAPGTHGLTGADGATLGADAHTRRSVSTARWTLRSGASCSRASGATGSSASCSSAWVATRPHVRRADDCIESKVGARNVISHNRARRGPAALRSAPQAKVRRAWSNDAAPGRRAVLPGRTSTTSTRSCSQQTASRSRRSWRACALRGLARA